MTRNRFSLFPQGHLMIGLDQSAYREIENKINNFLSSNLRGLRLENMSVQEDRVNLYYQYRSQRDFDWTAFTSGLNRIVSPAKVEVFIG